MTTNSKERDESFVPPHNASQPTPAGPVRTEERLGPLIGDRICVQCGYNLAGQQIVREPHYGMIIVRCSECGTAAALQEYPVLGRWANRWAVVLAGLWLLLVIALWAIFSGIAYGMMEETRRTVADPFAIFLAEQQYEWAEQQGLLEDPQSRWQYARGRYATVDQTWWNAQNPKQLLDEAGGWSKLIDSRAIASTWLGYAPFLMLIGAIWALLLPHVRRILLPVTTIAIIALAAVFWFVGESMGAGFVYWMPQVAAAELGWQISALFLSFAFIALGIGALIGRPLARMMIRWLLPPRMRGALAAVWLIDGLEPPGGRKSR